MRLFVYVTAVTLLIGYSLGASIPASRKSRVHGKLSNKDGGTVYPKVQGLSKTKVRAKVKSTEKKREEEPGPSEFNRRSDLGDDPDVSSKSLLCAIIIILTLGLQGVATGVDSLTQDSLILIKLS